MCGIFGGLGLSDGEILSLGKTLKNRGPDSFGKRTIGKRTVGERRLSFTGNFSAKPPFVSENGKITLVHNGEWYSFPEKFSGRDGTDSSAISNSIEKFGWKRALLGIDGPFSLAWLEDGHLYTARDPLGIRPLFWGDGRAFSSERKALWKIGSLPERTFRQPPGTVFLDGKPFGKLPLNRKFPKRKPLEELLKESVRKRVVSLERVSVAFSGGVDSSIVAKLALENCPGKVELIVCGLSGSEDFQRAESAGKELGASVKKIELKVTEKAVFEVSEAIETEDPFQIGIALPLYFLAKSARSKAVLTGQGADELFCGYRKYYSVPEKTAEKMSRKDILSIGEANCERDDMAAGRFGKEIRQPFLDRQIVGFALSLPIGEKLKGGTFRKIVLRKAALKLGLSEKVAFEPKKAIQYSTGTLKGVSSVLGKSI